MFTCILHLISTHPNDSELSSSSSCKKLHRAIPTDKTEYAVFSSYAIHVLQIQKSSLFASVGEHIFIFGAFVVGAIMP